MTEPSAMSRARAEIARYKEPETRFLVGKIDFWRPYCSHFNIAAEPNCTGASLWNVFHVREHPSNSILLEVLSREMGIGTKQYAHVSSAFGLVDDIADEFCRQSISAVLEESPDNKRLMHTCTSDKKEIDAYVMAALVNAVKMELLSIQWEVTHYPGSESTNPSGALCFFHSELSYLSLGKSEFSAVLSRTCNWRKTCSSRLQTLEKLTEANCCRLRAWISLTKKSFSSNNVKVATDLAGKESPYSYHAPLDVSSAPSLPPLGVIGTGLLSPELNAVLGKVFSIVDFADFSASPHNVAPTMFLD
jgi:hypothetical protein